MKAQAWSLALNASVAVDRADPTYIVNARTGQYRQRAHRIDRVEQGVPVTMCRVWVRGGLVYAEPSDCFVWCEHGCKPEVRV